MKAIAVVLLLMPLAIDACASPASMQLTTNSSFNSEANEVDAETVKFSRELAPINNEYTEALLRMPIVLYSSPEGKTILRAQAQEVTTLSPDVIELISAMRETVAAKRGVGLAAPQVGVSKRVVLVKRLDKPPQNPFVAYINPKIVFQSSETELDWEGCLSISGGKAKVARAKTIRVQAVNEQGENIEETVSGFVARIFQHEIDHLNGILFIDKKEPQALVP